jgi:WS/DGAT/MGAT family acyltransferase
MPRYERLSATDRTFLDVESPAYPQHIAVSMLFDAGPLRRSGGGIDAERVRAFVASRLHRIPRYRQRLAWIPVEGAPVWIDDDRFNVHYHVRHTALPAPGDERTLKRLAGRIMSQQLDRGKPLWEMWIVEGLEGDRFALITKTHHCMVDGIAGVDLMTVLLSPDPDEKEDPPVTWLPEKPPSGLELVQGEVTRRALLPLSLARRATEALLRPREALGEVLESAAALGEIFGAGLSSASDTPLNRELGPHRRFDWTRLPLSEVKAVKKALGGTVNDIVLCTVAGAIGSFLERRGVPRKIQEGLALRAMVPVSVRAARDRGRTGNQIALWAASLPVAVRDPRQRLAAVREVTANLKRSKQALGAEVLAGLSEWSVPNLLSIATRLSYRFRAANLVVTNVPGPQIELYLRGARMQAAYPMLNLLANHTLGVALFSYAGGLDWGFMADWDQVPDLHDFVLDVEHAFAELREAAEAGRQ